MRQNRALYFQIGGKKNCQIVITNCPIILLYNKIMYKYVGGIYSVQVHT